MTPVQAKTLPVIIQGTDVLAKAKTGTGKTLAFLIPSIEVLLHTPPPPLAGAIRVLCLSPTRELASQITKEAEILTRFQPMSTAVIYGGTPIKKDYGKFKVRKKYCRKQIHGKKKKSTQILTDVCTRMSMKRLVNHTVFFPLNVELEFHSSDDTCDP
jgi:Rad3-related DNA helicase